MMDNRNTKPSTARTLLRELQLAGLRLDDAAIAAALMERVRRRQRDDLMRQARMAGLSYRVISRVFGIDPALAHRVCRVALTSPDNKSTP